MIPSRLLRIALALSGSILAAAFQSPRPTTGRAASLTLGLTATAKRHPRDSCVVFTRRGSLDGPERKSLDGTDEGNDEDRWLVAKRSASAPPPLQRPVLVDPSVPLRQQGSQQLIDLKNSPLFSWVLPDEDLFAKLGFIAAIALGISFPISQVTYPDQPSQFLQALFACGVGVNSMLLLVILRIFSGWAFVLSRLEGNLLDYEERCVRMQAAEDEPLSQQRAHARRAQRIDRWRPARSWGGGRLRMRFGMLRVLTFGRTATAHAACGTVGGGKHETRW